MRMSDIYPSAKLKLATEQSIGLRSPVAHETLVVDEGREAILHELGGSPSTDDSV